MKILRIPLVCGNTDDDKFLASAASGKANIIVSGDSDLLRVSGYAGLRILKQKAFADRFLDEAA